MTAPPIWALTPGREAEEVGVVVALAAVEDVAVAGVAADHHVGAAAADQGAFAARVGHRHVGAGADQRVVASAAFEPVGVGVVAGLDHVAAVAAEQFVGAGPAFDADFDRGAAPSRRS